MTDEEVNKKFDVVAGHLAALAVGLQTLTERVERVAEKVDRNADAAASLLAIAEIHDREIAETNERLNALITTVERFISGGRGGQG